MLNLNAALSLFLRQNTSLQWVKRQILATPETGELAPCAWGPGLWFVLCTASLIAAFFAFRISPPLTAASVFLRRDGIKCAARGRRSCCVNVPFTLTSSDIRCGSASTALARLRPERLQGRQPVAPAFLARRACQHAKFRGDHLRSRCTRARLVALGCRRDSGKRLVKLPSNASASGFLRKMGAVESRNDFDIDGYAGPCPPQGKPHRYIITVYALKSADLRLRQSSPSLMFEHEIRTTALSSAQLVVTYGR